MGGEVPSRDDLSVETLEAEIQGLRARLAESEETIRAIRGGEVDAFVVHHKQGDRVYSLRGADHAYLSFVDHMRDGAVTLTEDYSVVFANRRFLELLGLPHARIAGSNLLDHVAPEDGYMAEALLQRARQRDSFGEISLIGRDANRIAVHLFAFAVDIEGLKSICVLVTDLTEINRYRYDLERMVEARTADLSDQNAELRRLSEAKNELVARLAVELEKPVADVEKIVMGVAPPASALSEDDTVPLSRDALVLVENALIRLNVLLRDVSMLAEIESGDVRLEYATVRLNELALSAAEEARQPAREKGIDIVVNAAQGEVSFVADGRKLRQILVALLLVCAESLEVGPLRINVGVDPELVARFEICAPGRALPADDLRCVLDGGADPAALSRVSESLPAMSIWTARRMAQFVRGDITIVETDASQCFVLTVPI
jgi:PAS domain S-box-containing protein